MPLASLLPARLDSAAMVVALAVAVSMVVGGSGSLIPVPEMLLEVSLAALFAIWLWLIPAERLLAMPRVVWLIAALVVALPMAQLVPLPPVLWHALSGRQLEMASLGLVGRQDSWQPLSVAPTRTLASLLAMLGFSAMLVMGASLNRGARTAVLAVMVAVALLSMVVGAGQMVGGYDNIFRFYVSEPSYLAGFQANHNAQADVLLIAIVACATVARDCIHEGYRDIGKRYVLGGSAFIITVLVLGVFLSASRTGITLLALALSAALVILRPVIHLSWRQTLLAAAAGVALLLLIGILLWHNAIIDRSLMRFRTIHDDRPDIWQNAWMVARNYLPWGSGMGSFLPVYASLERLDMVAITYPSRAENDYLELLVEAGVVGLAWGAAIIALLVHAAQKTLRMSEGVSRGQVICAISVLCQIGLHSLLDYPLRSMSIAAMTAIAAGLLILPPELSLRENAWKEQP